MDYLLVGLLLAAIPIVLPIASWVASRRTRSRVDELSGTIREQQSALDLLSVQVANLRRQAREAPVASGDSAGRAAPPVAPVPAPVVATSTPAPVVASPPAAAVTPPASREDQWTEWTQRRSRTTSPPPTAPPPPAPAVPRENLRPEVRSAAEQPARAPVVRSAPPPPPPRGPLGAASPPPPAFDVESLLGVKLFSGIAGLALVVAAIFFLKYSVEHGWLQPPIRVMIGILVAVTLLVVCEMKAARRYRVTANALDAAAIAILFSTFFAAHALWNLIPSLVTFVLLGIVTALAVLLSIRRESIFIAVLGLLGGFATPALLSTGENQPIPLFAYLMLLNVGLAWVAYRQTWPLLTVLTLVLTTIYQWIWVFKFLGASSLPLAMGIFALFPLVALAGLVLAKRKVPGDMATGADMTFEYTAMTAAALPLLFAVYLSTVPAYGNRPWLLFGFMLLVDAGLFAVAVGRGRALLHAAAAMVTLAVMACWLAFSYTSSAATPALAFCAIFVTFFTVTPLVAARTRHPLGDSGADIAAPLLLFVPATLARIEPSFSAPLPLFATLLALVLLIAWRAIAARRGVLYFVAAFFAIATQAAWSSTHLSLEALSTAVVIYAVFGTVAAAVPIIARRVGRPLEPRAGSGVVLISSLGLLLFLSSEPMAPASLWALALLLAIINAGLFIESGAGGLPAVSIAGSLVSWVVLQSWWLRAGAAVGVVPSLAVLTGLTLVTFAGHAWVQRTSRALAAGGDVGRAGRFGEGLYLGLIGHLFLLFVAINPAWSVPPWPLFGTLAVLTLASSAVSLVTEKTSLHAAGVIAAGAIVAAWTHASGASWALVGLLAAASATLFALLWTRIARHTLAVRAAAALLLLSEATTVIATAGGSAPFPAILITHVANLSVLVALTWSRRWRGLALWAVLAAGLAAAVQWQDGDLTVGWMRLLILAVAMYAVFIVYPLALGRRVQAERDPFVAAVLASVMLFFAGRAALTAAGYGWMVGALPVAEGAVMAILLRQLLRIEAPGARDPGRLALIAGAALAFVTVAIPLQVDRQWITIGWALEGAALAWLFRRIPHRGLLYILIALTTFKMFPVRSRVAGRSVSRRVVCWTGDVAGAGVARPSEVRPRQAGGTRAKPILAGTLIGIVAVVVVPSAQRASTERFRFERTIVTNGPGPQRLAIDLPILLGAEPYPRRDPRTQADRPPAAGVLAETGSVVDPELFKIRRPIPDGPSGLAALVLDAGALADSRGPDAGFADVRILDAANRQVPYVLERLAEPMAIQLTVEAAEPTASPRRPSTGFARSSYRLRLPAANLPASQIVLETPARVFQRTVQLAVERPPDRHRRDGWLDIIATTTWAHADRGQTAPVLLVPVRQVEARELWLSIEEGDNSPLPLGGVRLLLPSYRLRFYRPAGSALRLVYGRSDLSAPRYDLALLAPQMMGVQAVEVRALAETPGAGARPAFISPRGFWIFLSVAVLILLGVIVRLAGRRSL